MPNEIVGLRGDRVRLIPPDRRIHFDNALVWMNDPEITATIEFNFGVSPGAEAEYFERVERDRQTQLHWAIHDEQNRHIGFIDLREISWRHRCASGGLLIGDRLSWGKGYATDAVRVRTKFAFEQMGLHRIEGHTICPAMRKVYEKCGYVHEGTARQKIWRDGRWRDAELYAILEREYFAERRPSVVE